MGTSASPSDRAGAVDWDVARRVAARSASKGAPTPSFELRALESDLADLVPLAERLVAEETGLVPAGGPARARVTDRAGWVDANVANFARLLGPVTEKLAASGKGSRGLPPGVSRRVAGTEVGLLLGFMAGKVLGQYDQLLVDDDAPDEHDLIWFVGPNIIDLERRHGFPPREFRLWLALHEVTHRAQFEGVPWMRGYFSGLVQRTLDGVDPDPRKLLDALARAAGELVSGRNPLDEAGLVGLVASPPQREALDKVAGLMSLLEGHGDVVMNRAGADHVPGAERFAQTLHERRRRSGPAKLLTTLIGLDAKMRQYAEGEAFIAEVEAAGGRPLLDRVWQGAEWLPTRREIRDPASWIARAGTGRAAVPA